MQILIDGTTTRFQLACLSKLLLALASDTDFDAIGDLVAPQAKADPQPIKLIDDVPPAPASPDVDYGRDPLTVMRAAQTGGGVLDLKEEILRRMDQIPTEPPAPPKAARAPRKPKAAAEPPAPIPAIPVPPPVQMSIPTASAVPAQVPLPPQTAPTVPAVSVLPSVNPAVAVTPAPSVPAIPTISSAAPSAPVTGATGPAVSPPVNTVSTVTDSAAMRTAQNAGTAKEPGSPAPTTFPELMQWAMPHIAAKRMDNTTLTAACNAAGLPSLQSLIARQDLVGAVYTNLVAVLPQ